MNMESVTIAYFSPTGTTKTVAHAIAAGFNPKHTELFDITKPKARHEAFQASDDELLIVAVPVYMGRVPALLSEWLNAIKAHNTPAVCVVVYGNRVYDDALLELKDVLTKQGCIPIAGAAYIGEHSFSNSETPSLGRPDKDDLNHAESFGQKIREKLQSITSISESDELEVPGSFPYGGITELWDMDFIAVSELCNQCGLCVEVCPVGAVDTQNSSLIDQKKCITCCACLKRCPQRARTMKSGPVKEAQDRVNTLFIERKNPEVFL